MRNMPKTRDRQQPQTAATAREDGKVDGHMMEAGRPVGWWYGGGVVRDSDKMRIPSIK
jgi:hypothetical protein